MAIDRIQNFAYTRKVVREILSHKNVRVHLDLIAGLPLEGLTEFRKSFDDVMEVGAQVVQLGFLKVLKGSPMERLTERYGIVSSELAPYEVKYTDAITVEQLSELHEIEYLLERIYNSGLYYHTTHLAAPVAGGYYAFFDALRHRLKQDGMDPKKMGEQELALLIWQQVAEYPQAELLQVPCVWIGFCGHGGRRCLLLWKTGFLASGFLCSYAGIIGAEDAKRQASLALFPNRGFLF